MKTLLLALLLLAASPVDAAVELLPGLTPQTRLPGASFEPLRFRVTDASGAPVAGFVVRLLSSWDFDFRPQLRPAHEAANGSCGPDNPLHCIATTDARGEGVFPALVAEQEGTFVALIDAGYPEHGGYGVERAVLTAGTVDVRFVSIAGHRQTVIRGTTMQPFVTRFVAADGSPIAGANVSFDASDSGATPANATVVTDSQGFARSPVFTAGRGVGTFAVMAWATVPGTTERRPLYFEFTVLAENGTLHADYQSLWWGGLQESGWGVSFAQEGGDVLPVVFAYDASGQPTWYVVMNVWTAVMTWDMHELDAPAFQPRSSPFHSYDARRFELGSSVGSFKFTFDSDAQATLTGILNGSVEPRILKTLVRQDFSGDTVAPLTISSGMWWGGPSQNGWGLSIMQQPGGMFIVWMTYGDDGRPTWFVMPSGHWNGTSYEGSILRASGPRWPDFDTRLLRLESVGSFSFDFQDATHATFRWSVGTHAGSERIVKQPL
jgi:hypothetical protein